MKYLPIESITYKTRLKTNSSVRDDITRDNLKCTRIFIRM